MLPGVPKVMGRRVNLTDLKVHNNQDKGCRSFNFVLGFWLYLKNKQTLRFKIEELGSIEAKNSNSSIGFMLLEEGASCDMPLFF